MARPSKIRSYPPAEAHWEPSERDQRAELEHVDGQRRPFRAAALGLVALAAASLVAPDPLSPPALAFSCALSCAAAIVGWQFPVVRMLRRRSFPVALTVETDPPQLTVDQSGIVRKLSPAAIERLIVGADHVFLHLAEAEVLTIPCRVFERRGSLDGFVERIDRFRRRGVDPTHLDPPDRPSEGRSVWSFVYELPERSSLLTRDNDLHRHLVIALVIASLFALLSSSLRPHSSLWQSIQELLLLLLFAGTGALLFAVSGRPRAPHGRVTLSVGPEGGWMHTEEGSSHFQWSRVLGIEISPGLVALRFAERVVPVPSSAFVDEDARQRFVRQTRQWRREARLGKRPLALPREVPRRNPFAPPRSL